MPKIWWFYVRKKNATSWGVYDQDDQYIGSCPTEKMAEDWCRQLNREDS